MMHNLETVYRKMRMNAQVLPAEMLTVLKDLDQRLIELEGAKNETRVEKPKPSRRKSTKVSSEEVPSS